MLHVEQVVEVVADIVVGEVSIAFVGVIQEVVVVNRVYTEFEAMVPFGPIEDVADLPLAFQGVVDAVLVVLRAGIEAVVGPRFKFRNIGGGGDIGLGVRSERLLGLIVKFTAVL